MIQSPGELLLQQHLFSIPCRFPVRFGDSLHHAFCYVDPLRKDRRKGPMFLKTNNIRNTEEAV